MSIFYHSRLAILIGVLGTALPPMLLAQVTIGSGEDSTAESPCRACNIVKEGIFGPGLIGQVIYEKGTKGFYPATVIGINRNPRNAIRWRSEKGDTGMQDATAYFSEARMKELVADSGQANGGEYLSDVDRQARAAVVAACASYKAARASNEDGAVAAALLARRGCCESTAAHTFGYADSPICQ